MIKYVPAEPQKTQQQQKQNNFVIKNIYSYAVHSTVTYMATTVNLHQFQSVIYQHEPNSMPHLTVQRIQNAPNQLSNNK